jgi:hypothetical protein
MKFYCWKYRKDSDGSTTSWATKWMSGNVPGGRSRRRRAVQRAKEIFQEWMSKLLGERLQLMKLQKNQRGGSKKVYLQMQRTIYGSEQAARAFWVELQKAFTAMGYTRSNADPCLYFRWDENGELCLWLTWIDDCIIIGSKDGVDREKKKMMQLFEGDDVGPMEEYVGNKIDIREKTMKLTQPVLLQSFVDEFGVKGSGEQLPAKPGQVLSKGEEKDLLSENMQKKYRSEVGKLQYLSTWSRPDILNAVREVSRYLQAPTQVHYDAMLRIMDYCISTADWGRKISPARSWNGTKEFEFVVSETADAAYNQCPDSRKSVSGNTTEVNGVPVITRSFMQDTRKFSVTEAELDSLVSNVQDMLFTRTIIVSVGLRVALPMVARTDNMGVINLVNKLRLQQITGKFLYYSRAVDPTMNTALSSLASQQAKGTEQTAQDAVKFLNYCATHPDATLRYHASDMILKIHSDASYLSESKARSRSAGHFYMGNKDNDDDTHNGSILATTQIMKAVLSSASEAETGALFDNTKRATILRTTLDEMGHPQPATPVQTDNSTACGIANDNIKQQRSRAIDMWFYWVRDRVNQGQFHIYWGPGKLNLADYYSKHTPSAGAPSANARHLPVYRNGRAVQRSACKSARVYQTRTNAGFPGPDMQHRNASRAARQSRHAGHRYWLCIAKIAQTAADKSLCSFLSVHVITASLQCTLGRLPADCVNIVLRTRRAPSPNMAKVPTADEIASSFLEQPMPIIGKPTRSLLIPLREIVHANASQIHTTLGGGLYGYLGAFLPAADYTALNGAVVFNTPNYPGNVLAATHGGT